jgi:hypothetical protein
MAHKICPQCGTSAPVDAGFCTGCGRQYRTRFSPEAGQGSVSPAGPPAWLLRSAIGVMACVVALLLVVLHNRNSSSIHSPADVPVTQPDLSAARQPAPDAARHGAASTAPGAIPDPLEEAAKREIDQASMRIPGSEPQISKSDGRVHLRGGGSISKEEWEAAAQKVQASRLMKDSLPPPPVN